MTDYVASRILAAKLLAERQDPEDRKPPPEAPPRVAEVLRYIRRNLYDPDLQVAAIRRDLEIRDHNISTRFRRCLGVGIRRFIERERLAAARYLLTRTSLEVFLIADAVGYEHPETFCRAFRRRTGLSPTEYRDENRRINVKKK